MRGHIARRVCLGLPALAVIAIATAAPAQAANSASSAGAMPAALPLSAESPVLATAVDATIDAFADPAPDPAPDPSGSSGYPQGAGSAGSPQAKRWAIYAQSTFTAMNAFGFNAPYQGPQSLVPHDLRETWDATLFLGARPWTGGELWADPEIDQGFGIANTLGLAGYASGEAYKLGDAHPYERLQRLFFRQTFNLGGKLSDVAAGPNQLAGKQADTRLVITIGKFSVADVFDTNKYAHDPRGDFLNWSIIDAGAFDYAGDPWGFTLGATAELYTGPWTARAGFVNLSTVPAGMRPTKDYSEYQLLGEVEHRHAIAGHPGAIRFGLWLNHARMGSYSDAIAWGIANAQTPDTNQVLVMHNRLGGYINAEQELTGTLGAFLRASTANGAYGAYDFTDIDTSFSGGLSLAGNGWHRANDTLGIAFVANQISKQAQSYFAAGGMGILIGDGELPHPGTEKILEASYTWRPISLLAVTLDYQHAVNPAYNKDRGPVNILGARFHVAF